jgi:hypothetical protein
VVAVEKYGTTRISKSSIWVAANYAYALSVIKNTIPLYSMLLKQVIIVGSHLCRRGGLPSKRLSPNGTTAEYKEKR